MQGIEELKKLVELLESGKVNPEKVGIKAVESSKTLIIQDCKRGLDLSAHNVNLEEIAGMTGSVFVDALKKVAEKNPLKALAMLQFHQHIIKETFDKIA